jgi:hypothetical protein
MQSKCDIFVFYLCFLCPVFDLFKASVTGIQLMQNNICKNELPLRIWHCISISSASVSFSSAYRHTLVFQKLLGLELEGVILLLIPINPRIWWSSYEAHWPNLSDNISMWCRSSSSWCYILVILLLMLAVVRFWSSAAPFLFFRCQGFIICIILYSVTCQ